MFSQTVKQSWTTIPVWVLSVCSTVCVPPSPSCSCCPDGLFTRAMVRWPLSLSLSLSRPPPTHPIITDLMGAKQRPEDDRVSLLLCYFRLQQCHKLGNCNDVWFGNSDSLDFRPSGLVFVSKVPNYLYIHFIIVSLGQWSPHEQEKKNLSFAYIFLIFRKRWVL